MLLYYMAECLWTPDILTHMSMLNMYPALDRVLLGAIISSALTSVKAFH